MSKVEDFSNQAIVVIYNDGTIETCPIGYEVVHYYYMLDLQEESERFASALEKSHVDFRYEGKNPPSLFTTKHDYALAKEEGVIVFHNIEIIPGKVNPDDLIHFTITMPNTLSEEQKEAMSSIAEEHDLSECIFGVPGEKELVDIQFEEAKKIYSKQRTK